MIRTTAVPCISAATLACIACDSSASLSIEASLPTDAAIRLASGAPSAFSKTWAIATLRSSASIVTWRTETSRYIRPSRPAANPIRIRLRVEK